VPLYNYRCAAGHEAELLRRRDVDAVACPCGLRAGRLSVYRIHRAGAPEPRYRVSDYLEAAGELQHAAGRAAS